jgi:hypothetical protein
VAATLETNGFWIHTLLSGCQINRTQQPIAYATVFVARTGSFASSVEPQLVAEIRADPEYNQITPTYYQRGLRDVESLENPLRRSKK